MRIFQVIRATANASIPENKTWYRNLYEPMKELGHDVFLFLGDRGKKAWEKKDKKLLAIFSEDLLSTFKKEHKSAPFDLFFSYLTDGSIDPNVIEEIKRIGVPTVNFSCNNTHQFHRVSTISPYFDLNLHAEKDAKDKFLHIGAKPFWWPMASNPRYFKPHKITPSFEASFVGANYALRAEYISHLLCNKIDVHAFGPRWYCPNNFIWNSAKRCLLLTKSFATLNPESQLTNSSKLAQFDHTRMLNSVYPKNLHAPVSDDFMIELYSSSIISLGFLEVHHNNNPSGQVLRHLHLREFEAPMCGALYLTGYLNELEEMFVLDKEILVYRNRYELLDKIRWYSNHHSEAERIRKAGLERALRDHTYHRRYRDLFKKLGLSN